MAQKKWRWSDHHFTRLHWLQSPILQNPPTWRPASWFDLIWSTIECPTDLASEGLTVSQPKDFFSRGKQILHIDDVRCFVFSLPETSGGKTQKLRSFLDDERNKPLYRIPYKKVAITRHKRCFKQNGGGCIFQGFWIIFGISKSIWLVFHHPHLKLRPFATCSRENPSSRRLVYLVCWSPKHSKLF